MRLSLETRAIIAEIMENPGNIKLHIDDAYFAGFNQKVSQQQDIAKYFADKIVAELAINETSQVKDELQAFFYSSILCGLKKLKPDYFEGFLKHMGGSPLGMKYYIDVRFEKTKTACQEIFSGTAIKKQVMDQLITNQSQINLWIDTQFFGAVETNFKKINRNRLLMLGYIFGITYAVVSCIGVEATWLGMDVATICGIGAALVFGVLPDGLKNIIKVLDKINDGITLKLVDRKNVQVNSPESSYTKDLALVDAKASLDPDFDVAIVADIVSPHDMLLDATISDPFVVTADQKDLPSSKVKEKYAVATTAVPAVRASNVASAAATADKDVKKLTPGDFGEEYRDLKTECLSQFHGRGSLHIIWQAPRLTKLIGKKHADVYDDLFRICREGKEPRQRGQSGCKYLPTLGFFEIKGKGAERAYGDATKVLKTKDGTASAIVVSEFNRIGFH